MANELGSVSVGIGVNTDEFSNGLKAAQPAGVQTSAQCRCQKDGTTE